MKTNKKNTLIFVNNFKLICKNSNLLVIFELEEDKAFCITLSKAYVLKVIGSSLKKRFSTKEAA
ncbi:MAG: hypothetical protein CME69_12360 [Halobacteriovorax sp.]|nr:hypothetical protein [Halobacteriovorax sp.]|tara:strand:- start:551 stop:742 length:192 start_codon:yes stop_codon:yes gene_type:complete